MIKKIETNLTEKVKNNNEKVKKNNDSNYYIQKYSNRRKFNGYSILFADIETIININEEHEPIVIVILDKDGKPHVFNSMNDFMNYIILNFEDSLIYIHNLGRFDSTFILKWVVDNQNLIGKNIKVIERNNIIYEITLNKYRIHFRDSYLSIPLKLEDIGKNFCTEYKKDDFNYAEINNIYKNNPELIQKLCINDCLTLREGFFNFNNLIKNEFNIELNSSLTLPSLAFNIFKSKYYDNLLTPISKNPFKEDEFIRKSYAGGISEVFKPVLENGYCYDANSLYPFVMMNKKYPVGKGKFIDGKKININKFIGFIECKVKCDKELNFLTFRDPDRGLITPIGEWTSVYFHEEIKKAIDLGYSIEFIKGFKYEKEDYIFSDYVNDLYKIRKESKNKSMNQIAKLLMNSLYGRFGMKILLESTKFISEDELKRIKSENDVTNIHHLGNNLYTVSCKRKKGETSKEMFANSINIETAVQIASAVTSYARIYMYDFKNIKDNKCYYTDTDSIFLEKELDNKFVGDKLGDFKLEYKVDRALFIAPKVYCVKIKDSIDKIVMRGLKKSEYDHNEIIKIFERIIKNEKVSLFINRINNFKRNLLQLITYKQRMKIEFIFPFNKRIKVYDFKGYWIDSRPIKIKKL